MAIIEAKQIAEWKAALASASAPPHGINCDADGNVDEADEHFFEVARAAVPALLAEREELVAVLPEVERLVETERLARAALDRIAGHHDGTHHGCAACALVAYLAGRVPYRVSNEEE